jgi:hypothetical protein
VPLVTRRAPQDRRHAAINTGSNGAPGCRRAARLLSVAGTLVAGAVLIAAAGPMPAVASGPAAPAANPGAGAGGGGAPTPVQGPESYSLLTMSGALVGFGAALSAATPSPTAPAVGVAPTPDGAGDWVAEADGTVVPLGDATPHGSAAGTPLTHPVVGIAADPATGGYWLVAADGGVFAFDAPFLGSAGALALNAPIVGMAATPDGQGYWLVAADGGIFSYGDATFYGSTGAIHLNRPIVGMATTPDGQGYWLVAADGGIFTFGDATFYGSTGAIHLNRPIVGMAATPDGQGYWLVAADGGIFTFGQATFYGSAAGAHQQVVAMAVGAGGYQNPLRDVRSLRAERIDQGVDYGGSGPVYAIGDGVVTNTTNSGWPGGTFISYRLTDGPAAGRYVYVAENVVPAVSVGQAVTADTVLGTLVDAAPDMETGWANPPGLGDALAGASGQWNAQTDSQSLPTAYGANFSQLLAALGAPPGTGNGAPVGSLPAGGPTW